MGYYTDFYITIEGDCTTRDYNYLKDELDELYSFSDDLISGERVFTLNAKWRSYERDMIAISSKFPELLILVSGNGEEIGDIWKHWFKNGKSFYSKATITFEDYNEENLS